MQHLVHAKSAESRSMYSYAHGHEPVLVIWSSRKKRGGEGA